MKIVIISHSDCSGGAAMASWRLQKQLTDDGHVATMVVMDRRRFDDDRVVVAGTRLSRFVAFAGERASIYLHNGFSRKRLFRVSTASMGQRLSRMRVIKEASVVIVGWACQGLLSLKELDAIASMPGKRVVVIMHDLWWMTGVCHHPGDCRRFMADCGCCPLLASHSENDLSRTTWEHKRNIYDRHRSLRFVAVSNWVAQQARLSSLLRDFDVEVVHNPIDAEEFSIAPDEPIEQLSQYSGYRVVTMGAQRLDAPEKGLDKLIGALNLLADKCDGRNMPSDDDGKRVVALFYGAISDPSVLDQLRMPYIYLGEIADSRRLAAVMASSDVVVSASDRETFGLTLFEGVLSGCVAVGFGDDGRADIINHKVNGYLAAEGDVTDLARGIDWALNKVRKGSGDSLRREQRESVIAIAAERLQL